MKHIIFATIFIFAVCFANFIIYLAFLRFDFLKKYKNLLKIFLGIFAFLQIIFLILMRENFLNDEIYGFLAILLGWSFFFSLVLGFYLFCVFLFFCKKYGVKKAFLKIIFPNKTIEISQNQTQNHDKNTKNELSRRKFLKMCFEIWVLIVAFSMFFKGVKDAISTPKLKKVSLKNKKLKHNLKIAMISDVHLGKNLHKDFLLNIIKKINAQNPDIVVIVGDLIDTQINEIDYLDLLDDLKSKYGTFYVFGNHEYYHGIEQIHTKLKERKITILDNKNAIFEDFGIFGVNDLAGFKYSNDYEPNLDLVKKGINKNNVNILLAHQPLFVKKYDCSDFDLVLSGHTHAGQIFPFSLLVLAQQGFLYGLYKIASQTLLYVSSGAGFWGPSIRFLAPSEIALIELIKDENA